MGSVRIGGDLIGGQVDVSGSDQRPLDIAVGGNGVGASMTAYSASALDDVTPTNRGGIRGRRWEHPCAKGRRSASSHRPATGWVVPRLRDPGELAAVRPGLDFPPDHSEGR